MTLDLARCFTLIIAVPHPCFLRMSGFQLVINDNFNDLCSLLQVVLSSFSSIISSSVGISSQSLVSLDTPPFEPNSFVI